MQPNNSTADATVKAVEANASRLDLTWNLTLATVNSLDPVMVTCDGDTTPIAATPMVGLLVLNQRVYVMHVPPSGNFVIGFADPDYGRVKYLGANFTDNGTVASSAGAEAVIPSASWDVETTFNLEPGYMFEVHITGLFTSTNPADTVAIRVRKGAAAVAGTLLNSVQYIMAGGANGQTFDHIGYFKNSTTALVSTKLTLSIFRGAGSGTDNLFGNSAYPLLLRVSRIGLIADLPGLASSATSV